MRWALGVMCVVGLVGSSGLTAVLADEKPIQQLPRDVGGLAMTWTEPIQSVVERSHQFDPVSGLWFGLLEGSVKSVEQTIKFLFFDTQQPSRLPQEPGKRFRYTF